MKKNFVVLVYLSYLVAGCSVLPKLGLGGEDIWNDKSRMLPEGFPGFCRADIIVQGETSFWVIDYDTDQDNEPDLRVWYYIQAVTREGDKPVLQIYTNPHRVERLEMGMIPKLAKVDYELRGKVEQIWEDRGGRWAVVQPK